MENVLYLVSTLRRTGPTNQLLYIIKNLDRDKFTPVIITLSPEPSNSLKAEFIKEKIKVESLNLSRIKGFYNGGVYLKKIVNKYSPIVIHTQGLRADELAVKNLREYKKISSIRNYPFEDYPMKYGRVIGKVMAKRHVRALKRMDIPVTCSYTLKKIFKEKLNMEMQSIQNGVDINRFYPATMDEKKKLREKLEIPLDKKIFISVGSLIERKSPTIIVEAFSDNANLSNDLLYMLGEGPLQDKCKEINSENVIYPGFVDNIHEYLRAADYFISASRSEGLPNTVLESLAVGLPVCLSDIDQHLEILGENSNSGNTFKTDSLSDLRKKLSNLLENNYENMSKSAVDLVNRNFNDKNMSHQYQRLYSSIK